MKGEEAVESESRLVGWSRRSRRSQTSLVPLFTCGRQIAPGSPLVFLSSKHVVYSLGHTLARLDLLSKEVAYLPFTTLPASIAAVAVGGRGRFIAVAAATRTLDGRDQKICVHDVATGVVKSTILIVDPKLTNRALITDLAFSADGLFLAGLWGGENARVACWQWATQHMLAQTACGMHADSLTSHPKDARQFIACGPRFVAAFCLSDTETSLDRRNFKTHVSGEHCFTGQAWLAGGILAVCTQRGEVMFIQDGQQQSILRLETPLQCIAACGTGFVVGSEDNLVMRFRLLPPDAREERDGAWFAQARADTLPAAVLAIAVSPDHSLALAADAQGGLTPVDVQAFHSRAGLHSAPDALLGGNAFTDGVYNLAVQGGVLGIDAAALRPILAVIGKTGGIKILDYVSSRVMLTHQLGDMPTSMALHPLGMMLAVGFTERLLLFCIVGDQLQEISSVRMRRCSGLKYNYSGSRLAALQGNRINIFHGLTMRNEATLQGHLSDVAAVAWSRDETRLVSVGGSNLYHWDTGSWGRIVQEDLGDKSQDFTRFCLLDQPELRTVVQSSSGKTFCVRKGQVRDSYPDIQADSIVASADWGNVILHGTARGSVASLNLCKNASFRDANAMAASLPVREAWLHMGPIEHMVVLQASGLLFTAGADGVVALSRLPWPGAPMLLPDWPSCSLVLDGHIQEMKNSMTELQRVAEAAQKTAAFDIMQAERALAMKRRQVQQQIEQNMEVMRMHTLENNRLLEAAEARQQAALAQQESIHGRDLNLLEGGLLQQLQTERQQRTDTEAAHQAEADHAQKEKQMSDRAEAKLRAKLHLLKASNHRLLHEKAAALDKAAGSDAAASATQVRVDELDTEVARLRSDLQDRDQLIGIEFQSSKELRERVAALERANFVLNYQTQEAKRITEQNSAKLAQTQAQAKAAETRANSETSKATAANSALTAQKAQLKTLQMELAQASAHAAQRKAAISAAAPFGADGSAAGNSASQQQAQSASQERDAAAKLVSELGRKLDEARRRAREQVQERREEKVLLAGEIRALQEANASLKQEVAALRLSALQSAVPAQPAEMKPLPLSDLQLPRPSSPTTPSRTFREGVRASLLTSRQAPTSRPATTPDLQACGPAAHALRARSASPPPRGADNVGPSADAPIPGQALRLLSQGAHTAGAALAAHASMPSIHADQTTPMNLPHALPAPLPHTAAVHSASTAQPPPHDIFTPRPATPHRLSRHREASTLPHADALQGSSPRQPKGPTPVRHWKL
ncbi:hypothetical protein WJX73_007297 [Symbiochloris irregularis]|uniref:Uncharacterized protein n=1 Tax=Symbiochloris irregularis TaxID=706552 RepID=A0AAW1P3J2_9CHLO